MWMLVLMIWGSPVHDAQSSPQTTSIPGYLTEKDCLSAAPAAVARFTTAAPATTGYREIETRCVPRPPNM